MAREKQTPEDMARRVRAFEMYCSTDVHGQRPNIRAIALTLGITPQAVTYWKRVDHWDERVSKMDDKVAQDVAESSQALKTLLRGGLIRGLEALKNITLDPHAKADDVIKATETLAKIAKQFNAVDLDAAPLPKGMGAFNDSLEKGEGEPWAGESTNSLTPSPADLPTPAPMPPSTLELPALPPPSTPPTPLSSLVSATPSEPSATSDPNSLTLV